MTEREDHGLYHPEAAQHEPFSQEMAAWRNTVTSMQNAGGLRASEIASEGFDEPAEARSTAQVSQTFDTTTQESPAGVFDPSLHNAVVVLEHLVHVGLPEAERILDAEENGKARKGILNLREDILAKAKSNDEAASAATE